MRIPKNQIEVSWVGPESGKEWTFRPYLPCMFCMEGNPPSRYQNEQYCCGRTCERRLKRWCVSVGQDFDRLLSIYRASYPYGGSRGKTGDGFRLDEQSSGPLPPLFAQICDVLCSIFEKQLDHELQIR